MRKQFHSDSAVHPVWSYPLRGCSWGSSDIKPAPGLISPIRFVSPARRALSWLLQIAEEDSVSSTEPAKGVFFVARAREPGEPLSLSSPSLLQIMPAKSP